jgi:hypothetical protein
MSASASCGHNSGRTARKLALLQGALCELLHTDSSPLAGNPSLCLRPEEMRTEDLMRAYHAIGIVAVILVGFGLKLLFFSAPSAEADLRGVRSADMDIFQMHQNNKTLPEQKIHDMTFVFSEGD